MTENTSTKDQALATISDTLIEISETLESLLMLLQEREESFKARKSFDRKPSFRKSYDRDDRDDSGDDFGDRKPYRAGPKKDFGDKKPYRAGPKKDFGDKKPYAAKKPFGDKKPAGRGGKPAAGGAKRKTYTGGY